MKFMIFPQEPFFAKLVSAFSFQNDHIQEKVIICKPYSGLKQKWKPAPGETTKKCKLFSGRYTGRYMTREKI